MELYRLTGGLTALLLSGGLSLCLFIATKVKGSMPFDVAVFYMVVPSMVLFGLLFDVQAVWRRLMKISRVFKPSYIGSGMYWLIAWPFCKLLSDCLYGLYSLLKYGEAIFPSYFASFGFDGLIGFFIYQAIVGSGMGIIFFFAYGPVFAFITWVRKLLGMEISPHELAVKEELAEFGFRK